MGIEATLGLADPANLAGGLTPATSSAGPPLHRGCALGGKLTHDLGKGIGGEGEEVGRERERQAHHGGGVPASFPGFQHQCNKVRREEGRGQGWLVKTQVIFFQIKN